MTDEFRPADVGREILANGGVGLITAYTDDQHVTIDITQAFPSVNINSGEWVITGSPQTTVTPSAAGPVGASVNLTAAIGAWRPSDVGSYVRINGGIVKITGYASPTAVSGIVEAAMGAAVAAVAGSWSLEDTMWGGVYGYPRCGVFYQQRLWLGGSPGFPQHLWGSVIAEYFDFTLGDLDTDAISYQISNGEINPIVDLASADALIILTSGGEFSGIGGQEKPITPTNIQIKDQSAFGSFQSVQAIRVGNELMMVQRSGKKVRALSANQYSENQYEAPDISVMAEHITRPGIRATAYRAEPDSLLFAVRNDGQLATLTADRDQDVFAWTRQVTQGNYEDVECVPIEGGWATYVIVARVIEGVAVRYIERLVDDLHTDACLLGVSVGGAATWGGLDHLEGMTVMVKADGVYQGTFVVDGGEITIGRNAFNVEIGLAYGSTIRTLTPEFSAPVNPNQAAQISSHAVKVRLLDTIGCTINGQEIAFRNFGLDVLDRPPEPFTGDKVVGSIGWDDGKCEQLIQQNLPYDFHVLAVMQKLTINDG